MNLSQDQKPTIWLLKEHGTFMLDGKIELHSLKVNAMNICYESLLYILIYRFLHPIVYGEYPKMMQNIVKDRLPKFTIDEVKMVKGSFDLIGINQYTTFYIYDPHTKPPKHLGYQMDWNAGFACKKTNLCILFLTHKNTRKRARTCYVFVHLLYR